MHPHNPFMLTSGAIMANLFVKTNNQELFEILDQNEFQRRNTHYEPHTHYKKMPVELMYSSGHAVMSLDEFTTPYLVQRAFILEQKKHKNSDLVSDAIGLDYMGSAEFEFGAVRNSIVIMSMLDFLYKSYKLEDSELLSPNQDPLYVYGPFFKQDSLNNYKKYLLDIKANKIRLKERAIFDNHSLSIYSNPPNLWWDLTNNIIWSYNKHIIKKRIHMLIRNSVNTMVD